MYLIYYTTFHHHTHIMLNLDAFSLSQVLSMNDDYKKALFPTGSFDMDFPVPDLIGQTEILTEDHR